VLNFFKVLLAFATAALIVGTGVVAGLFWHFSHGLPDHKQLADYQPATVSRLYASDGRLLAEYAREKRVFVPVAAMPKRLLQAFVAAEDQRFFTHPGVDFVGVLRAVIANLSHPGQRPEGASGNHPAGGQELPAEQSGHPGAQDPRGHSRLPHRGHLFEGAHPRALSHEIYLGSGNYGVAQAAINYFDRSLGELSLSEIAYLAALPRRPTATTSCVTRKRPTPGATTCWAAWLEDGYISAAEMQQAKAEKLQLRHRGATESVQADFFAEEVRRNLLAAYGEKGLYEGGLTVSTTLDPAFQAVADKALRDGLIAYDLRHGWRGPYAKIPDMSLWEEEFARIAQRRPLSGPPGWQLAVVSKVDAQSVQLVGLPAASDGAPGEGTVPFAEMAWARPTLAGQTVGGALKPSRQRGERGRRDRGREGECPGRRRRQRQALSAENLCAAPGAQCRGRRGHHGHPRPAACSPCRAAGPTAAASSIAPSRRRASPARLSSPSSMSRRWMPV